jgi:hypothetical protein
MRFNVILSEEVVRKPSLLKANGLIKQSFCGISNGVSQDLWTTTVLDSFIPEISTSVKI